MNLYRITVAHYSPKDSHKSIQDYLLADNEEHVYDYINHNHNYGMWDDYNEEEEESEIYDEHDKVIGTETYKEKMLRVKGDMNDPDDSLEDLYYGQTRYGWELVKEGIIDYQEMIELGVFKTMDSKSD